MVFNCRLATTDSGGIQEETAYIGIPCLTLRPNTKRLVTILKGTNLLCNIEDIGKIVERILIENNRKCSIFRYWDGCTVQKIVKDLK